MVLHARVALLLVVSLAAALPAVGPDACAETCTAPGPPARNVLLISVDTLRADHLGLYGYPRDTSPRIDRLGREGVVFEHAIVQWPVTTPSMTSMFSGEYPHVTGVAVLAGVNPVPERLLMLPEALRGLGFRTAAVVSNGVLGPQNRFDQGFETYHALWKRNEVLEPTSAARVTQEARNELARLAAGGDRFFLWVHYLDPHDPYRPPPGYAERFVGDAWYASRRVPVNGDDDPWRGVPRSDFQRDGTDDLARYVARYDGEIRYVDEQIGVLIDALDASAAAPETLVVLLSDHGESLGEHDFYLNHGHVPYDEQLRVPLVFRWPDGRHAGRRIAKPVELRGLARTLLDAVGADPVANPFRGDSLLAAAERGDTSALSDHVFAAAGGSGTRAGSLFTLAVRHGDSKLVLPRSGWARVRHGGREMELYDLRSDPQETRDLTASRRTEAETLRSALLAWFEADPAVDWGARELAAGLDDATLGALRELGYLGEDADGAATASAAGVSHSSSSIPARR